MYCIPPELLVKYAHQQRENNMFAAGFNYQERVIKDNHLKFNRENGHLFFSQKTSFKKVTDEREEIGEISCSYELKTSDAKQTETKKSSYCPEKCVIL